MATVPVVTDITARVVTWNAQGIINAFRDHINATSGTTKLSIDAYTLNEGLTVGFLAGGEGQQVNLRKSGTNTIAVGIEPAGTITNPGDSIPTAPTGTSADWSGEHTWTPTTSLAAGSLLWCIEVDDAFFLLGTDITNTFHMAVLHAGRIAFSTNSAGAASAGQDGLGFIGGYGTGGILTTGGSGTAGWMTSTSDCSTIHWATNEWSDHVTQYSSVTAADCASTAHTTYRPLPALFIKANDIEGNSSDQNYGILKYVRNEDSNALPKARVDDVDSNQSWIHIYSTNSTTAGPLIIWNKTVTP